MNSSTTTTNVLPPGQNPIRLQSEECESKFHVSSKSDVPLLDDHSAKRREVESKFLDKSHTSMKPQVLPAGEIPIRLQSGDCEEQFHLSSQTELPLLDNHSAKRREVESKFLDKSHTSMKPQVLPKGETPIPLPSGKCEEKFHVTSQTNIPLLQE